MIRFILAIAAPLLVACPPPGDSGDTGDASAHPLSPPPWMWQAQHMTVPADRGWVFEEDPDFQLDDLTVPAVYVLPDGRFGMLATVMDDAEERLARSVLTSDDGLEWSEPEPLIYPEAFEPYCGNRLQDAAVWIQDEHRYRFVFEGLEDIIDGEERPLTETWLCHGVSTDGGAIEPAADYLWTGEREGECNSVLSALTTHDERGLVFYNGDLTHISAEGPGIRAFSIDPDGLDVRVETPGPLLPWHFVDPNPVYLEGGGLRLYHTWFPEVLTGSLEGTGLGAVDLDDELQPIDEPTLILEASGTEKTGTKPMDPTLLMLSDGQLVLYYTHVIRDGEILPGGIRRAFAVD